MSKSPIFWLSCLVILITGCTTTDSQDESTTSSDEVTAESTDSSTESTTEAPAPTESASDDVTLDNKGVGAGTAAAEAPAEESSIASEANAPAKNEISAPTTDPAPSTTEAPAPPPVTDDSLAATDAAGATAPSVTPPETSSAAEASSATAESAAAGAATGEALTGAETSDADAAVATSESTPTDTTSGQSGTVTPPVATSPAVASTLDQDRQRRYHTYGDRVFGSTRVQLAVNHPSFNEGQKGYSELYGKAKDYPTFTADWFPLDWWVNPGFSASVGGYSVTGMAAKKDSDPDVITPDENSKTNLLFIPLQGSLKIEMTPFRQKWIVLDGWVGYEYGWWQETTATASSIRGNGLVAGATSTGSTSTEKPTSKGVKSATVFGASAHILLNGLDERTVRSMISTMGISHVYLTPFFETVKTINKSGLTFGRNIYGIGFTFETLR